MSPTTLPPEMLDEKNSGVKKKKKNNPEVEMLALSTWSVNSSS